MNPARFNLIKYIKNEKLKKKKKNEGNKVKRGRKEGNSSSQEQER